MEQSNGKDSNVSRGSGGTKTGSGGWFKDKDK
jgi:hypothetical protein